MKQASLFETKRTACAVTGHRKLPADFDKEQVSNVLEQLLQEGVITFYNGLAVGFDLLCAEILVKLKTKYPGMRLIGCVPFYGQEKTFPAEDKKRYVSILQQCDEVVVLSEHYYKACCLVRDKYMTDRADVLVAYCVKKTGGAAYTVKQFLKRKDKDESDVLFVGQPAANGDETLG